MTKKIKTEPTSAAVEVAGVDLSGAPDKTVIVWRATKPLTAKEHESLSKKLRLEASKTGLNIILIPFSVSVEADNSGTDGDAEKSGAAGDAK